MLRKSLCAWLRECLRQVQAEVISNSSNKLHQTMYKEIFSAQGRDSQEKKIVEKIVEKLVEKFVEIYYTRKMKILE